MEEDALSRADNSVKESVVRDKYIPHESSKLMTKNGSNELIDTIAEDKDKRSGESNSDSLSDSGKGSNNRKSSKSGKSTTEKEQTDLIDVKGIEQTETDKFETGEKETMKKLSLDDEKNEETGDDIEEEILSEASDRTKADEIVDEEVLETEGDLNEVEEAAIENASVEEKTLESDHEIEEVITDNADNIVKEKELEDSQNKEVEEVIASNALEEEEAKSQSITAELEAFIEGHDFSDSDPKTTTEAKQEDKTGSEACAPKGDLDMGTFVDVVYCKSPCKRLHFREKKILN